jgi:hypothetical protein
MKSICVGLALALALFLPTPGSADRKKGADDLLVVEATMVKKGMLPATKCGVVLVSQLAVYRIDKLIVGHLAETQIVVEHLACRKDVLEGVKPGHRVILVLRATNSPPVRTNEIGIRDPSERVERYYVALRVALPTSCC